MRKIKVGILTFSDGRKYIHESLVKLNERYQEDLANALAATGEVEAIPGTEVIWNQGLAQREGRRLAEKGCNLTILNYAIWCYPHLSALATAFAPGPFLLFCNVHPSEPGMVGMLAAAGTMEQLGRVHTRIWGKVQDSVVLAKIMSFVKAAGSLSQLKGQTYGLFGGRPLGMYTAVSNLDQWQCMFGLDVEHIEQYDLVESSKKVEAKKVESAFQWLEKHVGKINYDGKALTPEKLKLQIRSYYAYREIIQERGLDFVGTKAHGDLTDHFVTMDIAEAFLNDPYDWDGTHEPIVAATEADMDGALTMQIFKYITGKPVLFSDVRHYDEKDGVWYLSNSGTHPTFFGAASDDPIENLRQVTFYPEVSYYPAGGASVHTFASPGKVTLARLARKGGRYWMAIVPGEFVQFPKNVAFEKGRACTPEWPIAFTRLECASDEFLATYPCNHIHGCYGNWENEMLHVAQILGIEAKVYRSRS
jgi:L-fucose/D-arabinose isomerase